MESSIVWSEEEYPVREFLQGSLPAVVRVAEGVYSGAGPNTPCSGEIYRLHTVASHQRAVCEASDGQLYSIPLDYPIKFSKTDGVAQSLCELCRQNELPFSVTMETTNSQFKLADELRTSINLGPLTVSDVINEKYIKANAIRPGFMSKAVVVFFGATNCRFHMGKDFDYANSTFAYSWEEFNKALDSIARTVDFKKTYHNLDILRYAETELVSSVVSTKDPLLRKRDSREKERAFGQFEAHTFATLVRPTSGAGEANITKTVMKNISSESVYGSRISFRRGSDSCLPGAMRSSGYVGHTLPAHRSCAPPNVAVVKPSAHERADSAGYAHASWRARDAGYISSVPSRLRDEVQHSPAPPAEGDAVPVYEQIDPNSMDAEIRRYMAATAAHDQRPTPAVPDQYLTPADVKGFGLPGPQPADSPLLIPASRDTIWPPAPGDAVTSEPVTSQAASQEKPRPPGRRPSVIKKKEEIPHDVESMTNQELVDCMILMNLEDYVPDFEQDQIDGALLRQLSKEDLVADYHMKATHAVKLCQFAQTGWRPH